MQGAVCLAKLKYCLDVGLHDKQRYMNQAYFCFIAERNYAS